VELRTDRRPQVEATVAGDFDEAVHTLKDAQSRTADQQAPGPSANQVGESSASDMRTLEDSERGADQAQAGFHGETQSGGLPVHFEADDLDWSRGRHDYFTVFDHETGTPIGSEHTCQRCFGQLPIEAEEEEVIDDDPVMDHRRRDNGGGHVEDIVLERERALRVDQMLVHRLCKEDSVREAHR
jgi:hypothetical protein